jgi:hypothetical protein
VWKVAALEFHFSIRTFQLLCGEWTVGHSCEGRDIRQETIAGDPGGMDDGGLRLDDGPRA